MTIDLPWTYDGGQGNHLSVDRDGDDVLLDTCHGDCQRSTHRPVRIHAVHLSAFIHQLIATATATPDKDTP